MWSTETGQEPIHHYQGPVAVHALALSPESPTMAAAAGLDVRLDCPDDRGYWRTLCQAQLSKPVSLSLSLPPGSLEAVEAGRLGTRCPQQNSLIVLGFYTCKPLCYFAGKVLYKQCLQPDFTTETK